MYRFYIASLFCAFLNLLFHLALSDPIPTLSPYEGMPSPLPDDSVDPSLDNPHRTSVNVDPTDPDAGSLDDETWTASGQTQKIKRGGYDNPFAHPNTRWTSHATMCPDYNYKPDSQGSCETWTFSGPNSLNTDNRTRPWTKNDLGSLAPDPFIACRYRKRGCTAKPVECWSDQIEYPGNPKIEDKVDKLECYPLKLDTQAANALQTAAPVTSGHKLRRQSEEEEEGGEDHDEEWEEGEGLEKRVDSNDLVMKRYDDEATNDGGDETDPDDGDDDDEDEDDQGFIHRLLHPPSSSSKKAKQKRRSHFKASSHNNAGVFGASPKKRSPSEDYPNEDEGEDGSEMERRGYHPVGVRPGKKGGGDTALVESSITEHVPTGTP
ncbi:MAG: hypothetical protein Q9227_007060 [Pyrenula ochraceoflavens]